MPVRNLAGDRIGRIAPVGERVHDLVCRVIEAVERLEVLAQPFVHAGEGLEDRDRGSEVRSQLTALAAAKVPERHRRHRIRGRPERETSDAQQAERKPHAVAVDSSGTRRRTPMPVPRLSAAITDSRFFSAFSNVFQA